MGHAEQPAAEPARRVDASGVCYGRAGFALSLVPRAGRLARRCAQLMREALRREKAAPVHAITAREGTVEGCADRTGADRVRVGAAPEVRVSGR